MLLYGGEFEMVVKIHADSKELFAIFAEEHTVQ